MEGLSSYPFKQDVTTEQNLHSYWPLFYAEIKTTRHTLLFKAYENYLNQQRHRV